MIEENKRSINLDAALDMIAKGFRVYATQPSKEPLFEVAPKGFKSASDDPEIAKVIWSNYPEAGIGIPTGEDLWVLDVEQEGLEQFSQLLAEHGELPKTPTTRTGGDGNHYLFAPDSRILSLAKIQGLPIDTRGAGGAIIVPPSLHESGKNYEWLVSLDEAELAVAPEWVVEFVTGESNSRFSVEHTDLATHPGVDDGSRNDTLCRLVGCHLSAHGKDELMKLAQAWGARCNPPMAEKVVEKTVASFVAKHQNQAKQQQLGKQAGEFEIVPFADIEPTKVSWLWQQRIPLGKLTILAGPAGLGKTFLSCDIAARVSTGQDFPDRTQGILGDVIMVSAEDGPADTIRPRLDAHHADVSRVRSLKCLKTPDGKEEILDLSAHIEQLDRALARYPECRLMIIDPISAYLGKTDSNNNSQVRGTLSPICNLAEKHSVAIVGISHFRKSEAKGIDKTLGSVAFVAAARAAWGLLPGPDDRDRRLLLPVKNNLGDASGLAFSIKAGRLIWEDDPVKTHIDDLETQDGTALGEAMNWLAANLADGPMKASDAKPKAEKKGISKRTLDRAKKEIGVKSHQVDGCWWWSLSCNTESEQTFVF